MKKCRCGCDSEPVWIVKSYDFDPYAPDNKGRYFEEHCCQTAMLYLVESSHELGFPHTREYIGDPKYYAAHLSAGYI